MGFGFLFSYGDNAGKVAYPTEGTEPPHNRSKP